MKNKKIIGLLTISFIFIIAYVLYTPVKTLYLSHEIINKIQKDKKVDSVQISREKLIETDRIYYNIEISSDSFEDYSYEDKIAFVNKMFTVVDAIGSKIMNIPMDELDETFFIDIQSSGNKYSVLTRNTLYKNDKKYAKTDYLKELIAKKFDLSNEEISVLQNIDDENMLQNILELDKQEATNEISYISAMRYFNNGNFSTAEQCFLSISDYKDSRTYLDKLAILTLLQGEWTSEEAGDKPKRTFSGWDVVYSSISIFTNRYAGSQYQYNLLTDGTIEIGLYKFYVKEGSLYQKRYNTLPDLKFKKISNDTTLPTLITLEDPRIGMTAEEVIASTWGAPEDKNITETTYKVYEQWCYSGYRYIYFENGIVTAIQK